MKYYKNFITYSLRTQPGKKLISFKTINKENAKINFKKTNKPKSKLNFLFPQIIKNPYKTTFSAFLPTKKPKPEKKSFYK